MVTMSNVWDRTTDVLRGRGAILAGIATAALFVPAVVRDSITLFLVPGSPAFALLAAAVTLVVVVLSLWGQMALVAVATDPATTRADAGAQATARLPAMLAITAVFVVAAIVLLIPPVVAIMSSGADFSGMARSGAMPQVGAGVVSFVGIYGLVLLVAIMVAVVRLVLLTPVVLNERRGLGAFRRSWELTRGLAWRIFGVFVLYLIVVGVAVSAVQFVTGALFGLLLNHVATVAFVAAVASGIVTTVFSVVAAAFTAQLYVAVTQRGVATVFE